MEQPGLDVAVVGPEVGVRSILHESGVHVVDADAADVADADVVVAVGEDALVDVARADSGAAILPVGLGEAYFAAPKQHARQAVRELLDGEHWTVEHPVVSVAVAGEDAGEAVLDVSLVTTEPARISEYAVAHDDEHVSAFRADAAVVATPAGSTGYTRAAGGSVLTPGTGLVVVPVAPFTTQTDSWVLADDLTVTVEREEEPVELVLDGDSWGTVPVQEPIDVVIDRHVEFVRTPATVSRD
ncbi:NAD(+)/NADH kinase [Haloparvum sp. AD34]